MHRPGAQGALGRTPKSDPRPFKGIKGKVAILNEYVHLCICMYVLFREPEFGSDLGIRSRTP